jgi:hypothetical protein
LELQTGSRNHKMLNERLPPGGINKPIRAICALGEEKFQHRDTIDRQAEVNDRRPPRCEGRLISSPRRDAGNACPTCRQTEIEMTVSLTAQEAKDLFSRMREAPTDPNKSLFDVMMPNGRKLADCTDEYTSAVGDALEGHGYPIDMIWATQLGPPRVTLRSGHGPLWQNAEPHFKTDLAGVRSGTVGKT